jgi:EF hand
MMCRAPDLPPGAGPGPMGEGLRAMDKNKDGKISKDEYTGPAPLFDRLDRNSDGFISSDELPGGRSGGARARGARRPSFTRIRPGSTPGRMEYTQNARKSRIFPVSRLG